MADPEHVEILKQGVAVWNAWRKANPHMPPNLRSADLREVSLGGDLSLGVDLREVDLRGARLDRAALSHAFLCGADLRNAQLSDVDLRHAKLREATLEGASLIRAKLDEAVLSGANLSRASLFGASLNGASMKGADLTGATLVSTDLRRADLSGAILINAHLDVAILVGANLKGAVLTGASAFGVSAWSVEIDAETVQLNIRATPSTEPAITVDSIEVAQFVYLLLHNEKIRDIIDTVGKKGVLLLGHFTEGRITVLERLRGAFRQRGYVPMVFDFDKPETKNFTETVRLLAGLSKFVIADLSTPKSAPYELGAIVSQTMIPFQPIIAAGETPFAMLQDLWINYPDRVFELIEYPSVDELIDVLDTEIIEPAETRFNELVLRKAERMMTRRL
jgi:uncharacterized protein YjbI with pentapeptide repeats